MKLFFATGNQMIYLFALILIGYVLTKIGILPDNTPKVLSGFENNVFIPALVMGTFINNFTVEKLKTAGVLFGFSFAVMVVVIPLSILIPKWMTKDRDIRNICTYGLAFSNFGYMGNSVVMALFPDLFVEYLIFTLPLWIAIYVWGVPELLMPRSEVDSIGSRLKKFFNPMLIGMVIGMTIGLTEAPIPAAMNSVIQTLGSCMSPVAMLLTGVTVAKISLKSIIKDRIIYMTTAIRLLLIPLAFIGVFALWNPSDTIVICTVCSLAMPLGLGTIVIPSAYGKDTTKAAGMALISHLLSCITIPLVFLLLQKIIGNG